MPIKKASGVVTPSKSKPKIKTKKADEKKNLAEKKPQKKVVRKKPAKKADPKKKVWAHGNKKDPKTWLTLQQEKFVRVYCGVEQGYLYDTFSEQLSKYEPRNCMWNATLSYLNAYPDSSYHAARSSAADLLANPSIKSRIKDTLEIAWWSTDNAKLQHLAVMNQNEEKSPKMRAIELFYRITGDLPDEKKITLELSDEARDSIEQILAWRSKAVKEIAEEIITTPSDLSDYPSSNDEWEND